MVELCAEVNTRGASEHGDRWKRVTPTKVERWMQEDLILQPDRPGRGRGPGRAVHYTQTHVERLVEVAALMRRYRSVDATAVALYVRGEDIPGERVKAAYEDLLKRYRAELTQASQQGVAKHAVQPDGKDLEVRDLTWADLMDFAEPILARTLKRDPLPGLLERFSEIETDLDSGLLRLARAILGIVLGAETSSDDVAFAELVFTGTEDEELNIRPGLFDRIEQAISRSEPKNYLRALPQAVRLKELFFVALNSSSDTIAVTLRSFVRDLGRDDEYELLSVLVVIPLAAEVIANQNMDEILDKMTDAIDGLEE